jgi:hypothetical protein
MSRNTTVPWTSLEVQSPRLFTAAGVVLLVAAANYAVPFLLDGVAFNNWVGLSVLVGRLLSLLAVAGLSVHLVDRSPRAAKTARAVVAVAVAFTVGLTTTAVLTNLGVETDLSTVFGLGTILLSILTYALYGSLLVRGGDGYAPVGGLLLVATGALLFGFLAQAALPTGLVGTVAESVLSASHVAIGYRLRGRPGATGRTEPAGDPAS